jgi:hypothetical protein
MGRKPEFKVSKAFTIGMQEAAFLAEKSHSMGMKASQYINWLLRQEMLEEMQREPTKPQAFCDECGNDRTHYIDAMISYGNKFKKG